jgi:hypothetical protein
MAAENHPVPCVQCSGWRVRRVYGPFLIGGTSGGEDDRSALPPAPVRNSGFIRRLRVTNSNIAIRSSGPTDGWIGHAELRNNKQDIVTDGDARLDIDHFDSDKDG